jgi:hypothetical protein
MILSILLVKPKNKKENNNDDKFTFSVIKMKWNNKQKNIARASTWSTNLIMKKGLQSKQRRQDGLWWWLQWRIGLQKQKSTKVHMEKVEVRQTQDGKGSSHFAIEDIEKDEYVVEYMGKIE